MNDAESPSILSLSQINRLRQARQIAEELEQYELQHSLARRIRQRRYERRWFKPIDLWDPAYQLFAAVAVHALILLLGLIAAIRTGLLP